jgi:hypothetical protein
MKWPVLFIHKGEGRSPFVVTRVVNGAVAHFMKGVPVLLDVDPHEEWALYERVELERLVDRLEKSREHVGYMERVHELKDQGVDRSLAELAELERVLDSQEEKR